MSKRTVSLLMTVIFTVLLFAQTMNVTAAAEEERQLNTTAPDSTSASSEEVTAPSAAMTQPTTEEIVPAVFPALTVNAVSNFFPNATADYNVKTKQVEVTYWFRSSLDVLSVQWYLVYDSSVLTLSEENNTPPTVCPAIGEKGVLALKDGYARYCASNARLLPFSKNETQFAHFVFDVVELSEEYPEITTVDLTVNMLVVSETDEKTKLSRPELEHVLVANEAFNDESIGNVRLTRRTALTESNFVQATHDEPLTSTASVTTVPATVPEDTSPSSALTPATHGEGDGSDRGKVSSGSPLYAFICLGVLCVMTSILFVMRKKEILYN